MMYANQTISNSYPALMEAFFETGVLKETISLAEQYLNLENERDNALLNRIEKQDFSQYLNTYSLRTQKIEKAVKKEISRKNSDELEERFYLLIHAIAGDACSVLGLYEANSDYKSRSQRIKEAFASRFGEDSTAIYLAITCARMFNTRTIGYTMPSRPEDQDETPEVCLKAVSYTDNIYAKIYFTILAMQNLIPPERKNILDSFKDIFTGAKKDSLIQNAMQIMDTVIIPESRTITEKTMFRIALAMASDYDKKYFILFNQELPHNQASFAEAVLKSQLDKDRILDAVERSDKLSPGYIGVIANAFEETERNSWYQSLKHKKQRLENLAKKFPKVFRARMEMETNITVCREMEDILKKLDPSYQGGNMQEKAKRICMNTIAEHNKDYKYQIEKYLLGSMSTEDFIRDVLPHLHPTNVGYVYGGKVQYASAYGLDEFAERCICYRILRDYDFYSVLSSLPGYDFKDHEANVIEILRRHEVPMIYIMNHIMVMLNNVYSNRSEIYQRTIQKLTEYADEIAQLDLKSRNVESRCARIEILGKTDQKKYNAELFASAKDSSKKVRDTLADYLPIPDENLNPEILNLLSGKKIAERELAVTLLEKKFPDAYQEAVKTALEKEKNDKLITRLSILLNQEIPEATKQANAGNVIDELTKGNKAKKVAWLFQNAFSPVHDISGNEVEEKYLIALANCYASMDICKFSRSETADQLAQNLNQTDRERFVQEVFSRFIDRGAEAKQKWVIYFTAILGGSEGIASVQHYIKEWSENSRGAIAAEAVRALAFNGSSPALMAVDAMARKFKNKQVRSAANTALVQAAEALHITREELADRIVPDLGFDENLCRIFDYGTRQFKVYLTPALELEIFEGDKKLKNLPKPGKSDDAEKAEQASKDFKEMKKQMKTAIQNQKARLEYVFLCDRKWTPDAWKALFIHKPVMHCFAIGLIWGAYDEQDKLLQTFRYMEDGSFTTSDEEEYELPENAVIGLVHPIELDKETISAWTEQLSDYEITQPFAQLNRPVYKILAEEVGKTTIQRFSGTELTNLSLINKMTKIGWEKGHAEDAGMFYDFERTDIAKQEKINDKMQYTGYYAELRFSGSYIAAGYMDAEDVTVEDVRIWKLSDQIKNDNALNLEQVNPRYFSEILAQLYEMLPQEENNA